LAREYNAPGGSVRKKAREKGKNFSTSLKRRVTIRTKPKRFLGKVGPGGSRIGTAEKKGKTTERHPLTKGVPDAVK